MSPDDPEGRALAEEWRRAYDPAEFPDTTPRAVRHGLNKMESYFKKVRDRFSVEDQAYLDLGFEQARTELDRRAIADLLRTAGPLPPDA